MEEQSKSRLLAQMGIQVWQSREPLAARDGTEASESQPVVPPAADRTAVVAESDWSALQKLADQCQACDLHIARTQVVFGSGNQKADWLFVGEAPGAEEDAQGEPFVGQAGQLLTAMLKAIKLERSQVYIANVVKCRPPGNRNPEAVEQQACGPFLQRQIALLQPKIIVALGAVAAHHLLECTDKVGVMRGQQLTYGTTEILLVVTYHPAYLLRSPGEKARSWQDLCGAVSRYQQSGESDGHAL